MYILLTSTNQYVVEYLLGHLALSPSLTEAKIFNNIYQAQDFKEFLKNECNTVCSVNTFIA